MSQRSMGVVVYLAYRHSADTGVQHSTGRTGTHLAHKGELLPPSDGVLLHLLPANTHTDVPAVVRLSHSLTTGVKSKSWNLYYKCLHLYLSFPSYKPNCRELRL